MATNAPKQTVPPRPATARPAPPQSALGSFGSALGTVAIAIGVGVLGAYMLDLHTHTCDACGHRWRHLGAFNVGDANAHTCGNCGVVQWWKDGVPHVFRSSLQASNAAAALRANAATRLQELRGVRPLGLPSEAPRSELPRSSEPVRLLTRGEPR
jgi:hypothetical protein